MLSFLKDLGKEKSINLSYIIFGSSIVNIIITGSVQGISNIYRFLIFVVEAALVVVFVSAKFKDKETREIK